MIGSHSIRIVRMYKHVGGMLPVTGSMHPETCHRAGDTVIAYAPVATKVYGDKHLDVKTRASLAESLFFPLIVQLCYLASKDCHFERSITQGYHEGCSSDFR